MTFAIPYTTNVIKLIKNPPLVISPCPLLLHYHVSVGQGLHNAHAAYPAEVQFWMKGGPEALYLSFRFTDLGGCRLQIDLLHHVLYHERGGLHPAGTHTLKNMTIWNEEQVVVLGVYRFHQDWPGAYQPDDSVSYDLMVQGTRYLKPLMGMILERPDNDRVYQFWT